MTSVPGASPPTPTKAATLHRREEMSNAAEGDVTVRTKPLTPEINKEVTRVAGGY